MKDDLIAPVGPPRRMGCAQMILLDTHIWVRWQNASETLPINILNCIAKSEDTLAVSAISCWEVAMLARKGRIELIMPVDEWIEEALAFTDILRTGMICGFPLKV